MKRTIIISFLLCFLNSVAQVNSAITDQLAQQLYSVSKNNAADLVYLQTSKTIYETEEDVWFKGYVLDAQDFTPSNRSKTLFVQLIGDKNDTIVWEKKYEIENGFVHGHLFLKSKLPEGTYTLSAYSSHSFVKEPTAFYALKKITVVNTITQKTNRVPLEKDSIVHFATFAEGGKLVSGIQSRLAFKAVNSKGIPVDVSGTLFENDIPLLSFKSSHAGMGSFDFIPDENKKYHIELSEPKSVSEKIYDIAPTESIGKTIHLLSNSREELSFKITQSTTAPEERIYLRLQLRGIVYSIATGILKKELIINIPLGDVPQGIAEVTLFTENALPVAERLVFVKHDQKLKIQTELNKTEFKTRDKANLKIKVTDQNGLAVVAHLGLSVYDAIYQNKADAKNIQTHYLLSTQLKGNIYNPTYYFDEKNQDRIEALDLVLLTQGWRDYVWNEVNLKEQRNQTPLVFDEIKGKVRFEKIKKNKLKTVGINLIVVATANENLKKHIIMTDSTGVFTAGSKEFKSGEGGYVYLELKSADNPKRIIDFSNNFFEGINNNRKNKSLVYPISSRQEIEIKIEVASPFVGRKTINKLKEVVIVSKNKNGFRDKYIGSLNSLVGLQFYEPSAYFCHFGIFMCPNHPPPKVKLNRDLTEAELLEMFNVVMIEGYYGKKIFYEAVYDEVTLMDSTPDYRNTLFWKSDIITDEKGEATVDFFCSDINSLFIGNIEGVSGEGLLGADNFQFKVKKSSNETK